MTPERRRLTRRYWRRQRTNRDIARLYRRRGRRKAWAGAALGLVVLLVVLAVCG